MNFHSLLTEPCSDFEVESDDEGFLIAIPIAESDDGMRVVSLDCRMDVIDGFNGFHVRTFEFSFSVTCVSFDDSELRFTTQDRAIAQEFIPSSSRPHIMPTLLEALKELVGSANPRTIYRVIKHPNLPAKALKKHQLITHTLEDMAYTITDEGTDSCGRPFYVMTLMD